MDTLPLTLLKYYDPSVRRSAVHGGRVRFHPHQRPAGPSVPALGQAALAQHDTHSGAGQYLCVVFVSCFTPFVFPIRLSCTKPLRP